MTNRRMAMVLGALMGGLGAYGCASDGDEAPAAAGGTGTETGGAAGSGGTGGTGGSAGTNATGGSVTGGDAGAGTAGTTGAGTTAGSAGTDATGGGGTAGQAAAGSAGTDGVWPCRDIPTTDDWARWPVVFENQTTGYGHDEIFVVIIGMNDNDEWCWIDETGNMNPMAAADNDAPGHLTKNGENYADYAWSLAESCDLTMPGYIGGGRMYISLGEPTYFRAADNGWAGPILSNPVDPNYDVIFDFYEFTFMHGQVPFGGNTSQVDQFGFPLVVTFNYAPLAITESVGIALTRQEVLDHFNSAVAPEFLTLVNDYRIIAPRSAPSFQPGGIHEDYLDATIDEFWTYYATNPFSMTRLGQTFAGGVVNDRFEFTMTPEGGDGPGPFYLDKPTTADVFGCTGAIAQSGMLTTELVFGAELCAAMNRGVALDTSLWYDPSAYYPASGTKNDYAMVFHELGLENRAYGFSYDDVNDQSSVKILTASGPLTDLTITIRD